MAKSCGIERDTKPEVFFTRWPTNSVACAFTLVHKVRTITPCRNLPVLTWPCPAMLVLAARCVRFDLQISASDLTFRRPCVGFSLSGDLTMNTVLGTGAGRFFFASRTRSPLLIRERFTNFSRRLPDASRILREPKHHVECHTYGIGIFFRFSGICRLSCRVKTGMRSSAGLPPVTFTLYVMPCGPPPPPPQPAV